MIGASAPGKILVAGEYAVIDGAEALMLAVDRRARARLGEGAADLSPFLAAARDELARELGRDHAAVAAAARVVVDTSTLREGDVKLGLGSSAAATVAAIGAALAAGLPGPLDRDRVHALAHRAHRAAQGRVGAPGSGADVAASSYGGAIAVRRGDDPEQPLAVRRIALPAELSIVAVWTGAAADTAILVARVRALRSADAGGYDRAVQPIADGAIALLNALERGSACAAVQAIGAAGEAVANLGRAAAVELESPIHRQLRRLAERRGGACKPTGAGAGDIALAVFDSQTAAAAFRRDVEGAGMLCPPLRVDPTGVEASLVSLEGPD